MDVAIVGLCSQSTAEYKFQPHICVCGSVGLSPRWVRVLPGKEQSRVTTFFKVPIQSSVGLFEGKPKVNVPFGLC